MPARQEFLRDVLQGLSRRPKTLPCKYFYDAHGAKLFESICQLDDYYLTRTELALLKKVGTEIAQCIGPHARVVEPGSGAGEKIRLLLHSLDRPLSYTPVDISAEILKRSADALGQTFPDLHITPIAGDFARVFLHPEQFCQQANDVTAEPQGKRVIFFPGSTIGNFPPERAVDFLLQLAGVAGSGGGLLIGVDLSKDTRILETAYDDAQGVTAAFNKNLLVRINHELNANFNTDHFQHQAFFNAGRQRIEMHLRSERAQSVSIDEHRFEFDAGETICTEYSHKYVPSRFEALGNAAGLSLERFWTD